MVRMAASWKPKILSSGGLLFAKLKLKWIGKGTLLCMIREAQFDWIKFWQTQEKTLTSTSILHPLPSRSVTEEPLKSAMLFLVLSLPHNLPEPQIMDTYAIEKGRVLSWNWSICDEHINTHNAGVNMRCLQAWF